MLGVEDWGENDQLTCTESLKRTLRKFKSEAMDKVKDTLKVQVHENDVSRLAKRAILSRLGRICDPSGVISPTTVEGKRIYRDTCEDERSWNAEVSPRITRQWNNWTK